MEEGNDRDSLPQKDEMIGEASDTKMLEGSSSTTQDVSHVPSVAHVSACGLGSNGALRSLSTERSGEPGPASSRTLEGSQQGQERMTWNNHTKNNARQEGLEPLNTDALPQLPCGFLGGGKRDKFDDDEDILEDADRQLAQRTTPGHLQDRLTVLQERALAAIRALPGECREDFDYGQVETRVWGLEALKHVLRMRLALQRNLMLCRPVVEEPEIPNAIELLAANLTLCVHNKGNRCYADSVLRMRCWIGCILGAFHSTVYAAAPAG